jgi:general secretion pathway protein J
MNRIPAYPEPWSRVPAGLCKKGSIEGFTLLEIMVAMFVFALLITTVFGSFRMVFSSTDAVGGDLAIYSSARTCLDRMAVDLLALKIMDYPRYKKPEFNDSEDPFRLLGETSEVDGIDFGRLTFTSLAHLPINGDQRQGVARIVYYAHQGPGETFVLRRADHLFPFPDFEESDNDPILCENLQALEFGYLDAEGESTDRWDSESADNEYTTPRGIEIRLTVGQPSRTKLFSTRIPLYVQRKTADENP